MCRIYAPVEMPATGEALGKGDVSVSSPTWVREKSPGAIWRDAWRVKGWLVDPRRAGQ